MPRGDLEQRCNQLEAGLRSLAETYSHNLRQMSFALQVNDGHLMVLQRVIQDLDSTSAQRTEFGKINLEKYYADYNQVNAAGAAPYWARGVSVEAAIAQAEADKKEKEQAKAASATVPEKGTEVFGGDYEGQDNKSTEPEQRDSGEGRGTNAEDTQPAEPSVSLSDSPA